MSEENIFKRYYNRFFGSPEKRSANGKVIRNLSLFIGGIYVIKKYGQYLVSF